MPQYRPSYVRDGRANGFVTDGDGGSARMVGSRPNSIGHGATGGAAVGIVAAGLATASACVGETEERAEARWRSVGTSLGGGEQRLRCVVAGETLPDGLSSAAAAAAAAYAAAATPALLLAKAPQNSGGGATPVGGGGGGGVMDAGWARASVPEAVTATLPVDMKDELLKLRCIGESPSPSPPSPTGAGGGGVRTAAPPRRWSCSAPTEAPVLAPPRP